VARAEVVSGDVAVKAQHAVARIEAATLNSAEQSPPPGEVPAAGGPLAPPVVVDVVDCQESTVALATADAPITV
jgi:hypothetical protein